MGILRITVDDTVRIEALAARVHTSVTGSSTLAATAAVRKAAEVRDLVAALAARGIGEDAIEVTGVRLATSDGRLLQGQKVHIELVVTATPAQLPDVLGVLATGSGTAVEYVEWVYEQFEASIEAAAKAMVKARRKADAIAAAAGLEVTGIANASDSWSMPEPRAEFAADSMMFASARGKAAAPLDLGIELSATTELQVHLSVDFELSS